MRRLIRTASAAVLALSAGLFLAAPAGADTTVVKPGFQPYATCTNCF